VYKEENKTLKTSCAKPKEIGTLKNILLQKPPFFLFLSFYCFFKYLAVWFVIKSQ